VLAPLFSVPSAQSWGIGEFPDAAAFARWLALAGQSFVQLLPVSEMPPAERSPYSSMTAMALDPIYIAVPRVPDFEGLGGEAALEPADRAALEDLRRAPGIPYREIRSMKETCLRHAWERFLRLEYARGSPRAARFDAFTRAESWWLDEYAIFRALVARFADRAWWEWPSPLATHDVEALRSVRPGLESEMAYRRYLQWIAAEQWAEARRQAWPVRMFGDLPFMVSGNSADVWERQSEFRMDATIGVPPDAFSETGQDWGLPPWRQEVMARNDFEWIRARARRSAALFDGIRVDHLVGLYRMYVRPSGPQQPPFFTPRGEPAQAALGETLIGIYLAAGAEVTAEDLGTVPDFVRQSLARLGVPGYCVLRWERRWNEPGQPFIDPREYPEVAVATLGTHDTEPIAAWWASLSAADRAGVMAIPTVRAQTPAGREKVLTMATYAPEVWDSLIKALLGSRSRLVILPLQDIFGWPDRINTPATIGDANWSWQMPWPVNALGNEREPLERAARLREWTHAAAR
jgi:4-alpha-glucanotransferase